MAFNKTKIPEGLTKVAKAGGGTAVLTTNSIDIEEKFLMVASSLNTVALMTK